MNEEDTRMKKINETDHGETIPDNEKSTCPRLIPDPSLLNDEAVSPKNLFFCNTANIIPNKEQSRKNFDEETIRELAKSIQEKGILQPLLVHRISESQFELIAGERRWRAAKIAGLKQVPVIIKESSEDVELLEIGLIENIQRENLNDIEEARAYKKLIEKYKYTQEELAEIIGKKRSTIANSLRLLILPENIQDLLTARQITAGHARALLSFQNKEEQEKKAKQIVHERLSVRQVESLTQTSQSSACETEAFHLSIIANTISKMLKTKVQVKKIGKKGSIVIEFISENELYRIISLLKKSAPKAEG